MIPPLLRENANFRRYFVGQAVSLLGDQITLIALPLTAVLALHASAGQMGALTTVALVPNLLFSLHAGSWVDRRGDRRRIMLATDVVHGVAIATIPVAYAFGHLTWTQLYVVAFTAGVFDVVFWVAYGGFFQTVVEREDYIAANAILNGNRGFAGLAGTSLGGVLVQLLRGPYALAVDSASFFWSALFLGRIDAPEPKPESKTGGVLEGARWLRNNPIMRPELLGVATINFFNFMFFALFVLYATRALHVQPAVLGVVLGVASLGAILGSLVTGRISRRIGLGPTLIVGCLLFTEPLVLVPAAGGPRALVIALLFCAEFGSGFGVMLLDISAASMSAGLVPTTLRSRVSGAFMVVNYGVRPLGTAVAGVLGSTIGLRPTLWIATLGPLLSMLILLPSPIRTLRDVPEVAP